MGKKLTKEQFILRAREVHGWKYDYSKVEYVNNRTKVCILCPDHGEFWQLPLSHLQGHGCKMCAKKTLTSNQFLECVRKIHNENGNNYVYDVRNYKNMSIEIPVVCEKHGVFYMNAKSLLRGRGCPLCGGNVKKNTNDFIEKAEQIYGNYYDYSKVKYIDAHTKVCIICPEHGEFWQTPNNHYRYIPQCCKKQSKLEQTVKDVLVSLNFKFVEQQTFDWLKYKGKLKLDFYLPDINTVIECQGEQHFSTFRYASDNEEKLKVRQNRDLYKYKLCNKYLKPHFIYFTNTKYKYCNGIKMISGVNNLIKKLKQINYETDNKPR